MQTILDHIGMEDRLHEYGNCFRTYFTLPGLLMSTLLVYKVEATCVHQAKYQNIH